MFGPSSIRGTVGLAVDTALDPATYVPGAGAVERVNEISLGGGSYESLKDMAVDFYVAVREAYVQNRRQHVRE